MTLTPQQLILFGDENQADSDGRDAANTNSQLVWPDGIIPYEFSPLITTQRRNDIETEFRAVNQKFSGCISIE